MGRDQAILNIRQIAAGFGRRLQLVTNTLVRQASSDLLLIRLILLSKMNCAINEQL